MKILYAHKSSDLSLLHKICLHTHVINKMDKLVQTLSVIYLTCVFNDRRSKEKRRGNMFWKSFTTEYSRISIQIKRAMTNYVTNNIFIERKKKTSEG